MNNTRTQITDNSGRWFDSAKAESYTDSGDFGGQTLYRTAGGRWVLCHWSRYEDSPSSYNIINPIEAAKWWVAYDEDRYFPVPDGLAEHVASLEVE